MSNYKHAWAKWEKMENLSKATGAIKKKQMEILELKIIITEMKNSMIRLTSRLAKAAERNPWMRRYSSINYPIWKTQRKSSKKMNRWQRKNKQTKNPCKLLVLFSHEKKTWANHTTGAHEICGSCFIFQFWCSCYLCLSFRGVCKARYKFQRNKYKLSDT